MTDIMKNNLLPAILVMVMLFSTSLILTPGPGELQPEVFEKGIISTDAIETNSAFTP
ncbi:MAG: hypothetical protein GY940_38060, partial [bacterium]|nr:hypothetical protein [bacterium]